MSDPRQQQPQRQRTEALAGAVEPCPQCGAMLATDQRYCLNCGRRRGEPRLDFTKHVQTRQAAPPAGQNGQAPPGAGAPPPDQKKRDYTPLAAAGGIAVLGLILLVGVLIGRGNNNEGSASTQPQRVVLQQGEGSETASNEKEKESGPLEANAKPSKKANGGKKASNKTVEPPASITASENELKALEEKSGEGNYSEESAKLPNEIATPGPAPPEDNKKPGAGSKATTIE